MATQKIDLRARWISRDTILVEDARNPQYFGKGLTLDEAVGDLLRTYASRFNLEFTIEGSNMLITDEDDDDEEDDEDLSV